MRWSAPNVVRVARSAELGAVVFHPPGAQDRRERRRLLPVLGVDRLTVVVRVEQQRPGRPGRLHLAPDQRVPRRLEDLRRQPALREHLAQAHGVLPDVLAIGGDVGDGQQIDELGDDGALVRGDPGVDLLFEPGGWRGEHRNPEHCEDAQRNQTSEEGHRIRATCRCRPYALEADAVSDGQVRTDHMCASSEARNTSMPESPAFAPFRSEGGEPES